MRQINSSGERFIMPMIRHWDYSRNGELSEKKLRCQLESRGYRVQCYVYSPGTYFPDHTHNVDKIDAVLSGRFRMHMQGETVVLEAGDSIEVPKGIVHSAEVIGDEPVISLDAIRVE